MQPHLHTFRERFQLNGSIIAPEQFAELVQHIRPAVESVHAKPSPIGELTTFEIATALGLRWFAEEDVDLAVIEVGLGGRLDATTTVMPSVTGITTIVPEHMQVLGNSLTDIAREKAGIAKFGVPLVVARQAEPILKTIQAVSAEVGAPLTVADSFIEPQQSAWLDGRPMMVAQMADTKETLTLGLIGYHQLANAGVAMAMCRAVGATGIPIPSSAIKAGFATIHWPARMEVVCREPLTMVDAGHTPEAVAAVIRSLREILGLRRGPVIFGALRDKRVPEMVAELRPFATSIFAVRAQHPRAWMPIQMLRHFPQLAPMEISTDATAALRSAQASCGDDEAVLAIGSLAVAADVREAAGLPCTRDPSPVTAE